MWPNSEIQYASKTIGFLNRWNFCKPFISVEMASWLNERFYLSGLQIYRISHFVASLLMTQIFIKIFRDTEKVILMKWAFFFTLLFAAVTSFIMCKNKIRTLHTSVIIFKLSHEINLCQLCVKKFDKSAFIKYCYIVWEEEPFCCCSLQTRLFATLNQSRLFLHDI